MPLAINTKKYASLCIKCKLRSQRWQIWFYLKTFPKKFTFILFVSFTNAYAALAAGFLICKTSEVRWIAKFYIILLWINFLILCLLNMPKSNIAYSTRRNGQFCHLINFSFYYTWLETTYWLWVSSQGYFWTWAKTYNFFMRWDYGTHNKTETTLRGQTTVYKESYKLNGTAINGMGRARLPLKIKDTKNTNLGNATTSSTI